MHASTVFFIGAGFTKAIADSAPTGNDFLARAFEPRWPFSGDPRLARLRDFLTRVYHPLELAEEYPRIEDLLSLLDFCISSRTALSKICSFDELIEIRAVVVYVISKMIQASIEERRADLHLARDFVNLVQRSRMQTVFISTNYDIILDNALLEVAESCHYGLPIRHAVELSESGKRPRRAHQTWHYRVDGQKKSGQINAGAFVLLKIHGSLNWVFCPKCDEIDLTTAEKGAAQIIEDNLFHFCSNANCTACYEPFLVTPTMRKLYEGRALKTLFGLAEAEISKAKRILFVGYSLPEADYHIRSMLTRGLARNSGQNEVRITAIEKVPQTDKDRALLEALTWRYRSLFGRQAQVEPIGLEGLLDRFAEIVCSDARA